MYNRKIEDLEKELVRLKKMNPEEKLSDLMFERYPKKWVECGEYLAGQDVMLSMAKKLLEVVDFDIAVKVIEALT